MFLICTGHVTRMGKVRNEVIHLVGNPEGIPKRRREDNIKINLTNRM